MSVIERYGIHTEEPAAPISQWAAKVDAEVIERLDDDAIGAILEERFRFLVGAGYDIRTAVALTARTDVDLAGKLS